MMSANVSTKRRNVREMKANKDFTTPKSRRQTLAPNQGLLTPQKDNKDGFTSLPRKILKSVRRSLAPETTTLRFRTDSEREIHEAYDREQEEKLALNGPSMRFALLGKHSNDPAVCHYYQVMDNLDMDLTLIGGMIKLHQHSYMLHKTSKWPINRDSANFFRSADPLCIAHDYRIPIRLVYLDQFSCEMVEPWYRDYYSRMAFEKTDKQFVYDQDDNTKYDKLFDEIGRDGFTMMTQEMHMMENYCKIKFELTKLKDFELGVEFWRRASPMHLPRNYQLALILSKRKGWNHEETERWFRMLYSEKCWRGGRDQDVYPIPVYE